MAYSYKGAISFGLVYIPIKLEAAAIPSDLSFNQLDKNTKSRVRYKKTCDACDGETIQNSDIVKAFEYEKDRYVIFDDAELEKLKTARDKTITIERFVDLDSIDPIFFNKPYYIVPTGAEKAYCLLRDALAATGKVGIAKTVLGQKETLVALRVRGGEMLLSTLYFAAEIRAGGARGIVAELSRSEREMARLIIEGMSGEFEPESYRDEYKERVRQAIEAKVAGQEISAPKERQVEVLDLMEALRRSVAQTAISEKKLTKDSKNSGESSNNSFGENKKSATKSSDKIDKSFKENAKSGKKAAAAKDGKVVAKSEKTATAKSERAIAAKSEKGVAAKSEKTEKTGTESGGGIISTTKKPKQDEKKSDSERKNSANRMVAKGR